jgi:hypothetical protein
VFRKAKYPGFAAGALLVVVTASAQTVVGGSPSVLIPAVGVAPTESVQVNVTNMAPFSPNGDVEPNCTGVILFLLRPCLQPKQCSSLRADRLFRHQRAELLVLDAVFFDRWDWRTASDSTGHKSGHND